MQRRGPGPRYSLHNAAGVLAVTFQSPELSTNGGRLEVLRPEGQRSYMYEYDVLYLLQHGWTLHVTYGSTRHNLSAGVVVTPPTARQKAAVVPVHALQSGESWRATWSAESVAKEFASFARVEDVACKLGITREAVYKHLKRLAKTYIVERRKFGYVEFRVTTRPVPNYDPTPRLPAIKSDARRTTYAELQDRLKRDRQASMAV